MTIAQNGKNSEASKSVTLESARIENELCEEPIANSKDDKNYGDDVENVYEANDI